MASPLTRRRDHVSIGGYVIDCFVTEQHTLDSDITQYPVEKGSDNTDNVRPKPREVTVEGMVSDTPIGDIMQLRASTSDATELETVSTVLGDVQGSLAPLDYLPSQECLAFLEKIHDSGEPIPLVTTLRPYDSVVLGSLQINLDDATGAALSFTATFQVMTFIVNNRTTVRVAAPSVAGKVNLGPKSTTDRKLVNRVVDPNTGAWFDPDMPNVNGGKGRWRYGAQPLPDGTYSFTPGAATTSDLDERGGLVNTISKKPGETVINPSQQLQIVPFPESNPVPATPGG